MSVMDDKKIQVKFINKIYRVEEVEYFVGHLINFVQMNKIICWFIYN